MTSLGRGLRATLIAALLYGTFFIYNEIGLFLIPPGGLLQEGVTAVVWRYPDEPFFNSPDAVTLRQGGEDQMRKRGSFTAHVKRDRFITALPYADWAYRFSLRSADASTRWP